MSVSARFYPHKICHIHVPGLILNRNVFFDINLMWNPSHPCWPLHVREEPQIFTPNFFTLIFSQHFFFPRFFFSPTFFSHKFFAPSLSPITSTLTPLHQTCNISHNLFSNSNIQVFGISGLPSIWGIQFCELFGCPIYFVESMTLPDVTHYTPKSFPPNIPPRRAGDFSLQIISNHNGGGMLPIPTPPSSRPHPYVRGLNRGQHFGPPDYRFVGFNKNQKLISVNCVLNTTSTKRQTAA